MKSTLTPMMQVFKNARTGEWKPVGDIKRAKGAFEWLNPDNFPLKKEIDIRLTPEQAPKRVSLHLSNEDRGWIEVDKFGQFLAKKQ